ncbi:MAG: O-methyltransferase [Chitinophagaceae bacterium]|nr:O-methyltransferase [Chitinophagaceae bacterium]
MDFINPLANDYTQAYSNATPSYLKSLFEDTLATHEHCHLQSSWTQGGFLSFISKMLAPSHILEIGSFTGFSALCLAEGLTKKGELHTIELREEDAKKAKAAFDINPRSKQLHMHVGDAKEIIPTLDKKWDLIFIDADKTSYIDYYNMAVPLLNDKGIIIVDNVLFHGEVLEDAVKGKSAKAIQAFNEHVFSDQNTEQVMLTIRDGLTLIRKK